MGKIKLRNSDDVFGAVLILALVGVIVSVLTLWPEQPRRAEGYTTVSHVR